MLKEFPPKFSTDQMFNDAKFIEILEFGILDSWQAKMVNQSFVLANHTLTEVIEFCEKEEITETMLSGRIPRNNPNQSQLTNKSSAQTPLTKDPLNPVIKLQTPRSSVLPIAMALMDAWFTSLQARTEPHLSPL